MNLGQKQDEDLASDTRSAMKAASERVSRDTSKVRELQQIGKLILAYCTGRGIDQRQNLQVLVAIKPGRPDTNLFNLESSIRDAGWSVITDFLSKTTVSDDKPITDEQADEFVEARYVCGLLRNALRIGADERALARVRAAIKRMEGN